MMIQFEAQVEKFDAKGEKSGWTYIAIPAEIARQIKAGVKTSFRLRGTIQGVEVSGLATVPMGAGDYILALNKSLRQKIDVKIGMKLLLALEEDVDFKIELPTDLELCLLENPLWLAQFMAQPKSHQNYFINWINSAKTETTRVKRLALTVSAMEHKQNYGEMIRAEKLKNT